MNPTDKHPEQFWNWFIANSERLTMLNDLDEPARQQLIDQMQQQLSAYCGGLTFEIGEQTAQGRTLTISAEGDFDLFRYVVELTDNAPDIDWWEFVPFRQPKGKALKVLFDKYRFETSKMAFMQLENEEEPDIIGLRVALPDLANGISPRPDQLDDDLLVGVYVTILIGYVELCPMPKEPFKAGFRPLDDLPEFVEWFKQQRDKANG